MYSVSSSLSGLRPLLASLSIVGSLSAGVIVSQNTAPAASVWPGTPLVATVATPNTQAFVGESFNGGGGTTSYAQTLTVPAGANYTLEALSLYAGGGTGTANAPVRLNLYDLGGRGIAELSSYSPRRNLLGAGEGLDIAYTAQNAGVLRLDLTDADRVQLIGGRTYVVELTSTAGATPLTWYRTGANTYAGGAAYRGRTWISGTSERDFGLALYTSPNFDPVPPETCIVDATKLHQRIDGFGAGVAFLDYPLDPLPQSRMDQLYGLDEGQFGLTLLRVRIDPNRNWAAAAVDGQRVMRHGARILATPWTPPASLKSNQNVVGGMLPAANYGAYVAFLNDFATHMASQGAPLAVISLQNEPDYQVTYESCDWTPAEILAFSRDYAAGLNVPYMIPESFNFNPASADPTLQDPGAAQNVDFIGGHLYGSSVRDYPLARQLGKPIWMTEFLINDQTMATALETAQQITDCLTVGNMSAYIWWKTTGNANGLLNAAGEPQRRGYVMGQFSRFIRPGDRRIELADNTGPLALSAFYAPQFQQVTIVAVNHTAEPIAQTFQLQGLQATELTPWVTSETQSLARLNPVAVVDGSFTYDVPAQSVVTFVGQAPREELAVQAFELTPEHVILTVANPQAAPLELWHSVDLGKTWEQASDVVQSSNNGETRLETANPGDTPMLYQARVANPAS